MTKIQLEQRMSRLIQKWNDEISDPLSDPERVGELLYRIREHDARMESVRASRIQNISSGVRKRDTQSRDFEYYLNLARRRNDPIDNSFRNALDRSFGIGCKSFNYMPSALIEEGRRQIATVDEYRNMLAERSSEVVTPLTTTPRRVSDPNPQARYYRQQEQFQRVMSGDYRQPLRAGDDDALQYALGADTGVRADFAYLREQEEEQNAVRRRHREAEARGSIRNRRERLMLMREFPVFFRNSRMSTRDMRQMARSLRSIEKTPVVGRLLRMNPVALASVAAIGITKGVSEFLEREDVANKRIVGLKNLNMLYGGVPGDIRLAAKASGMSDEDIIRAFGKTNIKFGGQARQIYSMYAAAAQGVPAFMRGMLAESFDLSDQEAVVAMRMRDKIGKSEANVAGKDIVDTALTAAASSEAPWYVRLGAWLIDNPLAFGLNRKALGRAVGRSIEGKAPVEISEVVGAASDIAQSGLTFDTSSSAGGGTTVNRGDTNVSFSFGDIITPNPDEFGQQIKTLGSQYLGDMSMWQDVLEKEDGKVR